MSIIIKGMKMPENCVDCDIVHEEENAYGEGYIHDNKGRLPECPLVEIPPHGRLIDADALEAEPCEVMEVRCWYYACGYSHDQIKNAPTIIEAEEAEQ